MFGILQKMDRFSNKLMSREEKTNFIQEIVDNGMFLDMHEKYFAEAVSLIGSGEVQAALPLVQDPPVDADGRDPFDVSICL
jgi:hypothetical protein|tara:strand:+ start:44 stop:286 length:243 start_codon:yes stop_codon:yes gene_type:complete